MCLPVMPSSDESVRSNGNDPLPFPIGSEELPSAEAAARRAAVKLRAMHVARRASCFAFTSLVSSRLLHSLLDVREIDSIVRKGQEIVMEAEALKDERKNKHGVMA